MVVGDDHMIVAKLVGLAIQRHDALAGPCAPDHEVAVHLVGIEHMQRPVDGEGQEVGDIDQRVDRPKPDGPEPRLHPFR